MPSPRKLVTKDDIIRAQKVSKSNLGAARYLHISFNTYKKYAKLYKDEDGVSLFERHKNQQGRGITKYSEDKKDHIPLSKISSGEVDIDTIGVQRYKERLIKEGVIEEKCHKCGFAERRVLDFKVPIILNRKDGHPKNWSFENLEFLCYNCSFLYAASPITDEQVAAKEDYIESKDDTFNWEMDEHHIEHLKELGLYNDDDNLDNGEEYISRL